MTTILCRRDGSWKRKVEEALNRNPNEHITLLALGKVKIDVLNYLNRRTDLNILKFETRYMKQRDKGLGLKVQIIKKFENPHS